MTGEEIHLIVAGPLDQRTGGYIYDSRIVAGLRAAGWLVHVHELVGTFPAGDDVAGASLRETLDRILTGARVVLDGLAVGALPSALGEHASRLRMVGLVHHPLADETGISEVEAARLRHLEREALSLCSGVIVTSPFTARRLDAYAVPAERIRVVLPGVDPSPPSTGPREGDPPELLCVATISPRKGQDVLVRALVRLRDLRWTCTCVGSLSREPDFASAVLAQVRSASLEDRIRFPGELDERGVQELYDGASLFVLPSHYEGYGMAITEALAHGLGVISTTGGAIPGTVPPNAGILVPPGEDAALADALAQMLAEPAGVVRRRRMGDAALEHVATLDDWDQAALAFGSAVHELVA